MNIFYQDINCNIPSDISNYDVLLSKHEDSHVEIMSFSDHIGNRRFQISLDIHRSSYNDALLDNNLEECELILKNVAETICHNCVPKGRFLEQDLSRIDANNMAQWYDLGDGPLARERIRRGILGLLFKLPIQTISDSLSLPSEDEKKSVHLNLADERFVVKDVPLTITETLSKKNGQNKSTDTLHFNDYDDMRSREINHNITAWTNAPTMISKSFITNEDVLLYGENADIIFKFNHLGNNRLHHFVIHKSQSRIFGDEVDRRFMEYTREVVQEFMQVYPSTRFLRQKNHTSTDMWIQMDVETAISKMSLPIFYASKYSGNKRYSDEQQQNRPNKRFKSESPHGSTNVALSHYHSQSRCYNNKSMAA